MRVPQEILDLVKDDALTGAVAVCTFALTSLSSGSGWDDRDEELLLEAYALLYTLEEAGKIEHLKTHPSITAGQHTTCVQIQRYLQEVHETLDLTLRAQTTKRKLDQLKNHFSLSINDAFGYEFTEGDLSRVQDIINELRGLLTKDSALDDGHKRRLLKRLEELQKELHKKVSDLSHFYGLMGDFGIAVGKLGTDAKPFTDRIRELIGVAWKAQARAEQLPSSAENPMLGHDGEPPLLG